MTESIYMQLKGFARGASAAVADPGAVYGVLMIMDMVLEAIACDQTLTHHPVLSVHTG